MANGGGRFQIAILPSYPQDSVYERNGVEMRHADCDCCASHGQSQVSRVLSTWFDPRPQFGTHARDERPPSVAWRYEGGAASPIIVFA